MVVCVSRCSLLHRGGVYIPIKNIYIEKAIQKVKKNLYIQKGVFNMKKVYLAGDMLKKGSQILREMEANQIRELGYEIHSPKDDKEINDKKNQTEESNNGLAEKIVYKDTNGILESEIIVIEPTNDALGTMVELGQIKGMKDMAKSIKAILTAYCGNKATIDEAIHTCDVMINKKVYAHYEDVRRTDIPEKGDRRSFGVNQYVYGVCLDLTDGKGFYEWDEIMEELRNAK
jgi:nucleoside 2-deoxyribosyltransferase